MVWETKGLTLEQVDRMMEEVGSPRRSAGWRPHGTFAAEMGLTEDGHLKLDKAKHIPHQEEHIPHQEATAETKV